MIETAFGALKTAFNLMGSTSPWYYEQRISNYLDGYEFGKKGSDEFWFRVDRLVVRENQCFPNGNMKQLPGAQFEGYTEIHIRCEETILTDEEWEDVEKKVVQDLTGDAAAAEERTISNSVQADVAARPDVTFDYSRGKENEIAVFAIQAVDREVLRFILGWRIGEAAASIAGQRNEK